MCTKNIYENYKFYLSIENTLCDSYVTEKLWWRMPFPVVPIVMGGLVRTD